MPPKKATTGDSEKKQSMIPADCVAVLLMALNNTSISKAQFDMMSALDGTRTASSFEHQFRPITQKAKELKTRVDAGETFDPVTPSKKRAAKDKPSVTGSPTKKTKANTEDNEENKYVYAGLRMRYILKLRDDSADTIL